MTALPAGDGPAWDAAGITRSWDQVVDEYKTFHSIRSRGGTVAELPELPTQEQETRPDAKPETNGPQEQDDGCDKPQQGEARGRHAGEAGVERGAEHTAGTAAASPHRRATTAGKPSSRMSILPDAPPVIAPQMVLGSLGGDENLKKLLMSWYYAGYYTGLYEGQQRQAQTDTVHEDVQEAPAGEEETPYEGVHEDVDQDFQEAEQ